MGKLQKGNRGAGAKKGEEMRIYIEDFVKSLQQQHSITELGSDKTITFETDSGNKFRISFEGNMLYVNFSDGRLSIYPVSSNAIYLE